jgi:hypothetical protein
MWGLREPDYSEPFHFELVDGSQALIIPGRRNLGAALYAGIFTLPWLAAGWFAIAQAVRSFQYPLLLLMGISACALIYTGAILAWQINGKEAIRVANGYLEVRTSGVGLHWTWRYPVKNIRSLRLAPQDATDAESAASSTMLIGVRKWGAVQFTNLWRDVYLAPSHYPEEAADIVAALTKMLPPVSTQPLSRQNFRF